MLVSPLIVFQRGASPRECYLLLFAIGDQRLVEELSAIIGIDPQDRKGEERASSSDSCQHRFLTPVQQRKTFRPPGCDIGERQRVDVASLAIGATMGHQVRFQKAGLGFLPLLECTDGNLLLEQRSRSRGGKAVLTQFALRTAGDPLLPHSWQAAACGTPLRSGGGDAFPALQ